MSDMAAVVVAMVWLCLGGFTFAKMPRDGLEAAAVVVGFFICLALAPAMFGFWLATRETRPALNPPTPSKETTP